MKGNVTCSCGHSWNTSDSSKKDVNVCHICGKDNTMKDGGWLDKYNDGGPVQPNYNDYSVSAPEGFEGDGYSNVGRNYSPAWGGQFAMGGSMPGSVGFMYARTNDPAPSNGPYAKKTKASAQDGIEIGADGIPIDNKTKKGNTSVKSTYANKKQDLHKLEGQLHTNLDIDKAIESSQNYIQNKDRGNYWGLHNGPLDAIRHTASAAQTSSQLANMFPGMKYNPGIMLGSILGTNAMGLAHELSSPNPWEEKASDLYNNLAGSIIGVMPGDEIKRNERITKALNNNTLSNLKGKNSGDRPFDPIIKNTIDKDKKGFFLPGKGPISNEWLDFREVMQNGGEMKYYQEGLDFQPKSISKNGSVIKDDRGQWDHPGEITEIGSNQITMQGVPYPVLGISDTGDTQMMYPNQEYEYDGESVTEYPMAQDGRSVAYADNTRLGAVPRYTRPSNYQGNQPDTLGENIFEVVDPSGISSWDDIYRSYNKTGMSGQTAMEAFGAIPFLGKAKKMGQFLDVVSKAVPKTGRQARNVKVSVAALKGIGKYGPNTGRATDAIQAYTQRNDYEQGGQLTKLDQLTNFTNYNTKQPGGWLSKYE